MTYQSIKAFCFLFESALTNDPPFSFFISQQSLKEQFLFELYLGWNLQIELMTCIKNNKLWKLILGRTWYPERILIKSSTSTYSPRQQKHILWSFLKCPPWTLRTSQTRPFSCPLLLIRMSWGYTLYVLNRTYLEPKLDELGTVGI